MLHVAATGVAEGIAAQQAAGRQGFEELGHPGRRIIGYPANQEGVGADGELVGGVGDVVIGLIDRCAVLGAFVADGYNGLCSISAPTASLFQL